MVVFDVIFWIVNRKYTYRKPLEAVSADIDNVSVRGIEKRMATVHGLRVACCIHVCLYHRGTVYVVCRLTRIEMMILLVEETIYSLRKGRWWTGVDDILRAYFQ